METLMASVNILGWYGNISGQMKNIRMLWQWLGK